MKAHELIKLLDIPESTMRKYAQDYDEYLSSPISKRHRDYTDQDARILKLIVEMKAKRTEPENIDATLSSLQAGGWQQLPELAEASSIVPTEQNLVAAKATMSAMQREIDVLREMLDRAEEREAAKSADRDNLLRRLERAETLLELYKSGELKPGS